MVNAEAQLGPYQTSIMELFCGHYYRKKTSIIDIDRVLNTPLRSSRLQIFFKSGVLKNFANFTGKHLCLNLFLIKLQASRLQLYQKETPTQVLSCEICKNFKNTFFYRTLPVTKPFSQAVNYFRKKTLS